MVRTRVHGAKQKKSAAWGRDCIQLCDGSYSQDQLAVDVWMQSCFTPNKRLSLYMSQVAHQAGAYPGFCSMKRLGIFLLPPGWDTSPSQGYPQH